MSLEKETRKIEVIKRSLKAKDRIQEKLNRRTKDNLRQHLSEVTRNKLEGKSEETLEGLERRENYIIELRAYKDYLKDRLKNRNCDRTTYYYYYWYYYWLNKFCKSY